MKVSLDGEPLDHKINKKVSVAELLLKLGMGRETVIVKVNGKIATEFDCAKPGDHIDLIRIASGG